jgi:hypothetical protein
MYLWNLKIEFFPSQGSVWFTLALKKCSCHCFLAILFVFFAKIVFCHKGKKETFFNSFPCEEWFERKDERGHDPKSRHLMPKLKNSVARFSEREMVSDQQFYLMIYMWITIFRVFWVFQFTNHGNSIFNLPWFKDSVVWGTVHEFSRRSPLSPCVQTAPGTSVWFSINFSDFKWFLFTDTQ